MDLSAILISMGGMGGIGLVFATGLAIANKKLHVEEDPRIEKVNDALPGANCGGCGFAGCMNFAENVVKGNAPINGCPVGGVETANKIAQILGVKVEAGEPLKARVLCQGGLNEMAVKGEYMGLESCVAAHISGGATKLCEWGCLGFGDCVDACPFDAMYMSENRLPVVIEDKCVGCGKCAEACPRNIIELHPVNHRVFVKCKNQDAGKYSRLVCTRACIGCGICVREAGDDMMYLDNGLAHFNYDKWGNRNELPTQKCPNHVLVSLDEEGTDS